MQSLVRGYQETWDSGLDSTDNAEHMFSIFSINDETEFYPPNFDQTSNVSNDHSMKLYFSKHKKPYY